MRRFLTITILIMFVAVLIPAYADDLEGSSDSSNSDYMQYSKLFENGFEGQKKITDEDFQKTVDKIKAKQSQKNKKNRPMKGKDFNQEDNGGYIDETASKDLLLTVPLELVNGDSADIPVGHYKIVGVKTNGDVYLDFYQAGMLVAKVPAIETDSDFGQQGINFVKLLPYNSERIKVIYGSIDFNAYTFIRIKDKISDTN